MIQFLLSLAFLPFTFGVTTSPSPVSKLTCTGETYFGDIVTITTCKDKDGLTSCDDNPVGYVVIRKENWKDAVKMAPPVIETVEIPSQFFTYETTEDGFNLKMITDDLGTVSIETTLGDASIVVNVKTIQNSFNLGLCQFN